MATGILPCGVMMGAWLLAASTGTAMRGSLTMLIFAVATLPGLLAPVLAGGVLTPALRRLRPAWYGWAWCLLAVWVGARPLMTALHGGH